MEEQEDLSELEGIWREIVHRMGNYVQFSCGHVVKDQIGLDEDAINGFCTDCNPDDLTDESYYSDGLID